MGKAFESIKQGLNEAIGHAKGKQAGVKVWQPSAVDVAEVRGRLGFTQAQFAARFGVSVATLRHWERGVRNPLQLLGGSGVVGQRGYPDAELWWTARQVRGCSGQRGSGAFRVP